MKEELRGRGGVGRDGGHGGSGEEGGGAGRADGCWGVTVGGGVEVARVGVGMEGDLQSKRSGVGVGFQAGQSRPESGVVTVIA